jgi:NAD(P)-dependent dehydrogenase (short-subunit alcohol dehydrogenase family)
MRAVIMGGTAGIGLAIADALHADGAEVIVTGRNPERLAAVKDRVTSAEQVDGTDPAAVADFFDQVGAFHHLVLAFSPGARGAGPFAQLTTDDVRAAFEGKLFAYLFAIQQAQVTGSITMISAASARAGLPGMVGLSAVNGATERVVAPLAAELAPVRVNAVAPGVIDTAWWSFLDETTKREQFAAMAEAVPLKATGQPSDVAQAVRYLIGAEFVTGTILPVDGGFTLA